jgi:hypothetical protein
MGSLPQKNITLLRTDKPYRAFYLAQVVWTLSTCLELLTCSLMSMLPDITFQTAWKSYMGGYFRVSFLQFCDAAEVAIIHNMI